MMVTNTALYKFKSGPLKGRRLDSIGMSFEIVSSDMAKFQNGTTAAFYCDDSPVLLNDQYICDDCRAKGITWFGACPHPRPPITKCSECGEDITKGHHSKSQGCWPADLQPVRTSNPEVLKTFDYPPGPPVNVRIENLENCETFETVYGDFHTTKLKIHGYAVLLGAFRTVDGKRLMHPCDPAYAVIERGQQKYTVTRQIVGTGWQEFSWIYGALRNVGQRNHIDAFFEAIRIYFL